MATPNVWLVGAVLLLAAVIASLPWTLDPVAPVYVCAPQQSVLVCQPMEGR